MKYPSVVFLVLLLRSMMDTIVAAAPVAVSVDGASKIITFVIDGVLCDGGEVGQYGWGRFSRDLDDVNGSPTLRVGKSLGRELALLRLYNRYLRTSEALANYHASAQRFSEPPDNSASKPNSVVAPNAELVEVYADDIFFEGPCWDPATGKLYFVAWGDDNKQLLRLDEPGKASVWMDQTQGINGTFISRRGRMLTAEVLGHKIGSYRIGEKGPEDGQVLAEDHTWNQPNDLYQSRRGDIYFSDPDWANRATSAVYRLAPTGKVTRVVTDMTTTNGIIVSNDDKTLYVADSFEKRWHAFPIAADGSVGRGRVFFDPDTDNQQDPDGMTIDERGNLYLTGRGGIWVVTPAGKTLTFIEVKEFCSNATFGGPDNQTLYITGQGKVYSLAMTVGGGR